MPSLKEERSQLLYDSFAYYEKRLLNRLEFTKG